VKKQDAIEQYVEKAAAAGIDPAVARQEAEELWNLFRNSNQPATQAPLVSPLAAKAFLPKTRG